MSGYDIAAWVILIIIALAAVAVSLTLARYLAGSRARGPTPGLTPFI